MMEEKLPSPPSNCLAVRAPRLEYLDHTSTDTTKHTTTTRGESIVQKNI